MTFSIYRFPETKPHPCFSAEDLFDLIYSGAKEENQKKLQLALQHGSINIQNNATPAYQLALEGTSQANQALRFLLKKYPEEKLALWKEMIRGYAYNGLKIKVNNILAKAGTPGERLTFLEEAAYGYAYGGHFTLIEDLLKKIRSPYEKLHLLKKIIAGYACGNYVIEARLLLLQANNTEEQTLLLRYMAHGYGSSGNETESMNLLEKIPAEEKKILLEELVMAYAQNGHIDKASKILDSLIHLPQYFTLLKYIAQGYTQGGYVTHSSFLLNHTKNEKERLALLKGLALGYARAGHITLIDDLLKKLTDKEQMIVLPRIASGYARCWHITAVDRFLENITKPDIKNRLLHQVGYDYSMARHVRAAYNILEKANPSYHASILKQMAKAMQKTGILIDKVSASFTIALFKPTHRKNLTLQLTNIGEIKINDTINKNSFKTVVTLNHIFNFRYIIEKNNWLPTQELLLITGLGLIKKGKLHSHTLLLIFSFLAPVSLKEGSHFFNELLAIYRPAFFKENVSQRKRITAREYKRSVATPLLTI